MNASRTIPHLICPSFLKQNQGDQLVTAKAASLSDEFMQTSSQISAAVDACLHELALADRQSALDLAMDVPLHIASGSGLGFMV